MTLGQQLVAMWSLGTFKLAAASWDWSFPPPCHLETKDDELFSTLGNRLNSCSGPCVTRWHFGFQLHQPAHVADFISVLLVKIILNYYHFWVFQKVQSYQKRICLLSTKLALLCPCFFTLLLRILFTSYLMLLNWEPFSFAKTFQHFRN